MAVFVAPILAVLVVGAWARPLVLNGLRALHILQLEEYQNVRFWRWLIGHPSNVLDAPFTATIVLVTAAVVLLPSPIWMLAPLAGAGFGLQQSLRAKRPEAKKPLVMTARARRLFGGWCVCLALIAVATGLVGQRMFGFGQSAPAPAILLALALASLLCWPLASLANLLLLPVEAGFRRYYLASARGVLRRHHPVVVGVAGSYGKTSTKSILARILSSRYPALATPRSFNTPMGLCRVIREQLQPEHRYFVAELGAYRRGEIRQLCNLVQPTIGVLTSVGPEHLERFGSMDNVIKAEFELIEALPTDGVAIFNGADPTCRELAAKSRCRYVLAGGEADSHRTVWAEDVNLTSAGLEFSLCLSDGRRAPVSTRLLGRHNVSNILVASAAALESGLSLEDVIMAIPHLEPVEHRLQLIPNPNGVVVIDDTYNSNPRGAATALETLAAFQGGRRYLVTPGMIELADLQEAAHREFGRQAARVCDGVILIGPKQTRAIADGLAEAGFSDKSLIVARNLAEATEHLKSLLQRGDAVLFENDLPDNYDE